ncbi:MAG: thiamine phosphate synthase [Actinomycetota bacterium]|nr:thiamine phosphate synthase [Actinomycetota bacterium]
MILPRLVVLTDGSQTAGRDLVEVVAAAVAGGARAVVLREKDRPRSQRLALAEDLRELLGGVQGTLIVASDVTIEADGVHLAGADPFPEAPPALVGRSCHGPESLAAAAAEGCTHAFLSPVFPTRSKPGYGPALGLAALAASPLPTWALGGVVAANAGRCLGAGAAGVAVMGEIMRAGDPAEAAAGLLAALSRPAFSLQAGAATTPRSGAPARDRGRRGGPPTRPAQP